MNLEKINIPVKILHATNLVKGALDEMTNGYMTGNKNYKQLYYLEFYKIFIGILLGAAAILSYFHKTPFPLDKHIIAFFTTCYFIVYGIYHLVFLRYREKDIIFEYRVLDIKEIQKYKIENFKNYNNKDNIYLTVSSKINEYTYTMSKTIKINKKEVLNSSKSLEYNEYIYQDGKINIEKFIKFIDSIN